MFCDCTSFTGCDWIYFSAGLLDFTLFGILQGNAKTNWIVVVVLGFVYFFLYYGVFKFLIVKYDLKTPGRDESIKVFDKKKYDFSFDKSLIDPRSQMIVQGLGGRSNFTDLDCCITRLRATIKDDTLINERLLKNRGLQLLCVSQMRFKLFMVLRLRI